MHVGKGASSAVGCKTWPGVQRAFFCHWSVNNRIVDFASSEAEIKRQKQQTRSGWKLKQPNKTRLCGEGEKIAMLSAHNLDCFKNLQSSHNRVCCGNCVHYVACDTLYVEWGP